MSRMSRISPDEVRRVLEAEGITTLAPLMLSLAQHESGFKPGARASDTFGDKFTAKGIYQFTDPTWVDVWKGHEGPLPDVMDWVWSTKGAARLVRTLEGRIRKRFPDIPQPLLEKAIIAGYHGGTGLSAERLVQAAQGDYKGGIGRDWWRDTKKHVNNVVGARETYAGGVTLESDVAEQQQAAGQPRTGAAARPLAATIPESVQRLVDAALPSHVGGARIPTGIGGGGGAGEGKPVGAFRSRFSDKTSYEEEQERRRRNLAEAGGMAAEAIAKIFEKPAKRETKGVEITPHREEMVDPWAAANAYFRGGGGGS